MDLTIAERVCEVLSLLFDPSVSATMWFIFQDLPFRLKPVVEGTLSEALVGYVPHKSHRLV